jgi:hypothetical protein
MVILGSSSKYCYELEVKKALKYPFSSLAVLKNQHDYNYGHLDSCKVFDLWG